MNPNNGDAMRVFEEFPKIGRLFKDVIVTEKIDGTNAQVYITPLGEFDAAFVQATDAPSRQEVAVVSYNGVQYGVYAGSRTRLITPGKGTDNFGFAEFVRKNAEAMVVVLGEGRHFGEWWGPGIQRGYGLTEKRFSLFNTQRWHTTDNGSAPFTDLIPNVGVVPVLYQGPFSTDAIRDCMRRLAEQGSVASPGFMVPEGVIAYHTAAKALFKFTFDDNHKG
jgi:hypothetical protein